MILVHLFHFENLVGGKMLLLLEIDNKSSVHVDNKEKDMLALSEGATQGLDDTTQKLIAVELKFSIIFTRSKKEIA